MIATKQTAYAAAKEYIKSCWTTATGADSCAQATAITKCLDAGKELIKCWG